MWIGRDIVDSLREVVGSRPVALLTGSRQSGKTSLLRRAFSEHHYVSLDLPADAEEAEEDGLRFLDRHGRPLIIDEVQYAPRLLRFIKAVVDRDRERSGQFILTGSQKLSLMAGVTESLAGRISLLDLYSLSLSELEHGLGERAEGETFWRWLHCGGYPELHARGLDPVRFYSDYVATYLERDVRQALQVRNLRDFDRFLRLCALRTGQLVNANALAVEVGVAATTIKSWLNVLEASTVILLLPPYFRNAGKRLVKTPKLYFLDTGLACFLAGLRAPRDIEASALRGALFETQVVGQIVRYFANQGRAGDLCFYRDHHGTEVDLVRFSGERLHLIECKVAESPNSHVPAFEQLAAIYGEQNIMARTIITPRRGHRWTRGVQFDDCVELASLGAGWIVAG
ncbi:ATP-binding protein [Myxococcota bacterium]